MEVKVVILLVCFIIGVNSFIAQSSEERRSWRDDAGRNTKSKGHGHASDIREQFQQNRLDDQVYNQMGSEERRQMRLGDYVRRNQEHYTEGGQEEVLGQKLKIKYSSSSSSSSEEESDESHEIRQVQKQYHDTIPYNHGIRWVRKPDTHKHANAHLPEFHNAIDKDQ